MIKRKKKKRKREKELLNPPQNNLYRTSVNTRKKTGSVCIHIYTAVRTTNLCLRPFPAACSLLPSRAIDRFALVLPGTISYLSLALLAHPIDTRGCDSPLDGQVWDAERSARALRDRFAFHQVPQPTHDPPLCPVNCTRLSDLHD